MQHLAAELWVTVQRLADATGEPVARIYDAVHDGMPCTRRGRRIRVRLADWLAYWEARSSAAQSR